MPSFLIDKNTNGWFTYLYYIVPNYYTNNVMATAFGSNLGGMIHSLSDTLGDIAGPMGDKDVLNILSTYDNEDYSSFDTLFKALLTGGNVGSDRVVDGVAYSKIDMSEYDLNSFIETLQGEGFTWCSNSLGSANIKHIDSTDLPNELMNSLMAISNNNENYQFISDVYNNETLFNISLNWLWGKEITIGEKTIILYKEDISPLLEIFSFSLKYISWNKVDSILSINMSVLPMMTDIFSKLSTLIVKIDSMFNVAHWWDYSIPWIETILLLLVAVKFFKWS